MASLRPADLAREHGISPQTVRNHERDGLLPPADRTSSGHRRYTARHAAALRAYRALVPAHGYAEAAAIMRAVTGGRLEEALAAVDRGHAELLRDRGTLEAVGEVLARLGGASGRASGGASWRGRRGVAASFTIGELARRLGVSVATVRAWEKAGVLSPERRSDSGHRVYDADDVRDAELAHFLRRGGYPLAVIATVVRQVRAAGDTRALEAALDDWRGRVAARGRAMLAAAALLSDYLALEEAAGAG
ncbi:MerR family transcriptional regulator [Streptomyces sp. R302]|uniref:MerR family transcriptional regulator n=1 Tax=unclassified Streptomyces TaxID=2593676 RepID=UPI00145D0A02|nr:MULTISPECIES: MerR family transcriptional regulator [unclassified Streptomyces]NML55420.1 MerR family transcriptional regulator [Streptomyces sp. R301]NML79660.1 MerR family transcriptional regulator [Streptomyces sp. R302]